MKQTIKVVLAVAIILTLAYLTIHPFADIIHSNRPLSRVTLLIALVLFVRALVEGSTVLRLRGRIVADLVPAMARGRHAILAMKCTQLC